MAESLQQQLIRDGAIAWVLQRAEENGGWISRDDLIYGFTPLGESEALPLIDPGGRGIRNPKLLQATFSVSTSPKGPYKDENGGDGLLHYAYQKGGSGGSNIKLRRALELQVPLLYTVNTATNVHVPIAPVYVVADDVAKSHFVIALDEGFKDAIPDATDLSEGQRQYSLRLAKQRLHQPVFRGEVLRAYEGRCAICRLAHPRLLEAAHIYPDSHPDGTATVSNGLSLCSIHHSAYDGNMLGISPDYEVRINGDLLVEVDGPMLKHGLQEMHGVKLTLPARRSQAPKRAALSYRFDAFLAG